MGDKVLIKENENTMDKEGIRCQLAHEHCSGPWEATKIAIPGLNYEVTIMEREILTRGASAANIQLFQIRPSEMCHHFGDEFAHLAWEAGLGASRAITLSFAIVSTVFCALVNFAAFNQKPQPMETYLFCTHKRN